MKIIFDKDTLLEAMAPALGMVSDRNTITATEGILIACAEREGKIGAANLFTDGTDIESNPIALCAYDLEKGIRTVIPARVVEPGSCIINAGKLTRILRTFPAGEFTLEVDDRMIAKISCGRSQFEVHVLPGKDFPNLPELSGENAFGITRSELKGIFARISHAIAQNDSRKALNGAYLTAHGDKILAVACDGNRIALCEKSCSLTCKNRSGGEVADINIEMIIPGKALGEMTKLIGDGEEEVTVTLGRKHIIFRSGAYCFFARLIDTDYIDYHRFIPKEHKFECVLDRASLENALERASLVTEERNLGQAKSPVRLEFTKGALMVLTNSVTGSFTDEIPYEKEGDELLIGFNCRYLLDALRASSGERIRITGTSSLMSIVIEPADELEGERFLHLVSPCKM